MPTVRGVTETTIFIRKFIRHRRVIEWPEGAEAAPRNVFWRNGRSITELQQARRKARKVAAEIAR